MVLSTEKNSFQEDAERLVTLFENLEGKIFHEYLTDDQYGAPESGGWE
jgi:hypothetical protein